jgi:hypothetical protein
VVVVQSECGADIEREKKDNVDVVKW